MFRWTVHLEEAPNKYLFHAAVAVGDRLYSFGRDRSMNIGEQIKVNIFNTVTSRWAKLSPVTIGRGKRHPDVPSGRCGHTVVLIGASIYLCGGKTYADEFGNMLYAFDVRSHRWSKPEVSGKVPAGRFCHSASVLGKVMLIYGGNTQLTGPPEYTNHIYQLDTATMVWSLINIGGALSSSHSAAIIGTKMFIFGGCGNEDKNIRVFDTETNCWLRTPSAQLLPDRRSGHSAFSYNGKLYIAFGGKSPEESCDDLWKFSPGTITWKKVEPKGEGPRSMHLMGCCMVGDRIFLFGGLGASDDLYVLDLRPSLKTLCKLAVVQYDLRQPELPHNIRWELAATENPRKENLESDSNGEPVSEGERLT